MTKGIEMATTPEELAAQMQDIDRGGGNSAGLTFNDALRIARGCTDYCGGYVYNKEHYEIFQHGIQTVINALTAASEKGLSDTQTYALHVMGANAELTGAAKRLPVE